MECCFEEFTQFTINFPKIFSILATRGRDLPLGASGFSIQSPNDPDGPQIEMPKSKPKKISEGARVQLKNDKQTVEQMLKAASTTVKGFASARPARTSRAMESRPRA